MNDLICMWLLLTSRTSHMLLSFQVLSLPHSRYTVFYSLTLENDHSSLIVLTNTVATWSTLIKQRASRLSR
jgi:hypothetical protein